KPGPALAKYDLLRQPELSGGLRGAQEHRAAPRAGGGDEGLQGASGRLAPPDALTHGVQGVEELTGEPRPLDLALELVRAPLLTDAGADAAAGAQQHLS